MRVSKTKSFNTIATALRETEDPAVAAKLLRQASFADVSHRTLAAAGVTPPGYEYHADVGRFMRPHSEGAEVDRDVPALATLAQVATHAFTIIDRSYATKVDKRFGAWVFPDDKQLDGTRAVATLHREPTAEGRARLARRALALSSAVLGSSNPKGLWQQMPNGTLGAHRAAEVLAKPFPRHQPPTDEPFPAVSWALHPASEAVGSPLVFRHEPLLHVTHRGTPVIAPSPRRSEVVKGAAARTYDAYQDTVFAVDPAIADDLMGEPDQLEAAYAAHGKGWGDMIVPAAGFVMLDQTVEISTLPR
jgi:hypothetical protein